MKPKLKSVEVSGIFTVFFIIGLAFIPCLFLWQGFILDGLPYKLDKMNAPLPEAVFYSEEEILAVYKLMNIIKLNIILEIVYLFVFTFLYPLVKAFDIIKLGKNKSNLFKAIYIITLIIILAVFVLTIFANVEFYSQVILKYYNIRFLLFSSVPCHILGLCFCLLVWRNFFDEVVLFVKYVVKKIKKVLYACKYPSIFD